MNYRSDIDGLRAVAVSLVVISHAGFSWMKGGFVGVDVFFVISGFLITSILLKELEESRFTLSGFYERRVRRILPALFFVLLCCSPIALLILLPDELVDYATASASVLAFISNAYYMFRGGYFSHDFDENFLLHTWSLAVEEQYYIAFPIAFYLLFKFARSHMLLSIGIAAFLSLGLAEWGWRSHPQASFYATPMRAFELLGGAWCALYLAKTNGPKVASSLLGTVGLILIVFAAFMYHPGIPFPSVYAVVPVAGSMLVVLYGSRDRLAHRLLSVGPIVGLGAVSYSAYLWHQPIFAIARVKGWFNDVTVYGWLLLVVGLAWLTWRWVENPFRNRAQLRYRTVCFLLAGAGITILLFSALSIWTNGFLRSYPKEDRSLISIDAIEVGRYVRANFSAHHLKPYSDANDPKVLVIGDSFAKDFTNMLVENSDIAKFQLSTFEIRPGCGNLYLKFDFTDKINSKKAGVCKAAGWYENEAFFKLLLEADLVVVTSSWAIWETEFIAQSVKNIRDRTNGRILVVGRKSFGEIEIRRYLGIPFSDRAKFRQAIHPSTSQVNKAMASALSDTGFLDISQLICGSQEQCRVFTDDGQLISRDGSHLTQDGARFAGQLMLNAKALGLHR